jgi:hypothetical protein
MAYELFLEQLPFEAETAAEIMTMHLRAVPPPASEAWPDIPTELEDLIHSMLAKNPLHRPTMLEVARKLEVVREELDRRRSQPITLPKVATGAAVEPAPIAEPLVVTQAPAVAKHRWQWFVGAAAVATCAMLLLVSQLVDSNAATASTLGDTPALLAPTPVEVAKPVIHKPTIAVNEPAAQPVVAPVVVEPKPVAKPTRQKPRYQLAPVAPRRNAKLDPDGTYDPYK